MEEAEGNGIATRWSLLRRLQDWDDQDSWREFFETYWKLIYQAGRRAGLKDVEAQEVVQETVISVAKKMHVFKMDPVFGHFKGYLRQIVSWRIKDQFRKRKSERFAEVAEEDSKRTPLIEQVPDPDSVSIEAFWEEDWERNLADAALDQLRSSADPKNFQIFYLHKVKGIAAKTVALRMNASESNVYVIAHRLEKLLREKVERLRSDFF